uniref:Ig-like domain-containing protein n=1 Tax=Apteryx owenii TaxID=8824 RepID=A0A8B9PFX3_APTOW
MVPVSLHASTRPTTRPHSPHVPPCVPTHPHGPRVPPRVPTSHRVSPRSPCLTTCPHTSPRSPCPTMLPHVPPRVPAVPMSLHTSPHIAMVPVSHHASPRPTARPTTHPHVPPCVPVVPMSHHASPRVPAVPVSHHTSPGKGWAIRSIVDWVVTSGGLGHGGPYVPHLYGRRSRAEPPKVTLLPNPLVVAPGSAAELLCDISGYYPLDVAVTWQRQAGDTGVPLPLRDTWTSGHYLGPNGTFSRRSGARLSPAQLRHGDTYACVVTHVGLPTPLRVTVQVQVAGTAGPSLEDAVGLFLVAFVLYGLFQWLRGFGEYRAGLCGAP